MASLHSVGWRQGSLFTCEIPAHVVRLGEAGEPDAVISTQASWIVSTQDCDLDMLDESDNEGTVEILPTFEDAPPQDWGIRSRRLKLTETRHVDAGQPRVRVSAALLASQSGSREAIPDDRTIAFKTWLGYRYDRPAVPANLVPLAREIAQHAGRKPERVVAEEVHDVLMQFDMQSAVPTVQLIAVVSDSANKMVVREWLAGVSLLVDESLGIVGSIEVGTKAEVSLAVVETSYTADLSQLTWRTSPPTGVA